MVTGLSRAEVAQLVDDGVVLIGGKPVKARSARVAAGEVLEVDVPAVVAATTPTPDPSVDFAAVYVDDDLIVVDKPAGLVVHPGAGNQQGTLVHGLLARWPELAATAQAGGEDRPGIVHRLDKGTSGLLVVARTSVARRVLIEQLAERTMQRRYSALVWGTVEEDEGLIDAPIQRAEADPTRMAIRAGGREARTRYEVEHRYHRPVDVTLLDCRLETGRTHQIRVHLSAIGHPVLGDPRYARGNHPWPSGLSKLTAGRVWLHARQLAFDHPTTGAHLSFASPLPEDLARVLEGLG
jgi:23S rRNA pseudouridine1911/1915/1917 synthase